MATAARKARKAEQRATGKGFQHPVKVGTPLKERAWWTQLVQGPAGTRHELERQERSTKKRERALAARSEGEN